MAHEDMILHRLKDAQRRLFRVACDPLRYGLTLKVVSLDSGIPYSTLRTYADGSAAMPMAAFIRLFGVIPTELLSMLLPGDFAVCEPRDAVDHDTLAARAIDFAGHHARARHPDSPGGVEITNDEDHELRVKAGTLGA